MALYMSIGQHYATVDEHNTSIHMCACVFDDRVCCVLAILLLLLICTDIH